ncbi:MAG: DnaD domain protein [Fastidiosipilaceae bacterium]|jgi:DnaD/phage-associated family protein
MKVERRENPLFTDLRLPSIFVDSIMPRLSGSAVKLFLALLLALKRGEAIETTILSARTGLSDTEVTAALNELQQEQVLRLTSSGTIVLFDLKDIALRKEYRRRTDSDLSDAVDRTAMNDQRVRLMTDISDAFFQGMMSAGWYSEIDRWFEEYDFEPEVMYALFSDCYNRNKLANRSYIRAVAADWASRGIRTYVDLSRDQADRTIVNQTISQVSKTLNRHMTSHDKELVRKWVCVFHFEFDLIDVALKKLSGIQNPNLNYVDKVLENWHNQGLTTPEAVRAHEMERQAENQTADWRSGGKMAGSFKGKSDNVGNFPQRSYSPEEYEAFFVDIMDENVLNKEPANIDQASFGPKGGESRSNTD